MKEHLKKWNMQHNVITSDCLFLQGTVKPNKIAMQCVLGLGVLFISAVLYEKDMDYCLSWMAKPAFIQYSSFFLSL